MDKTGKFIVIDGGEGTGTTTMSKYVAENKQMLWTREPGGSPFAEDIRKLILSDVAKHADAETMFGLFWAARRDHLLQTVAPALMSGKGVVCDRFDSSTWAYQIIAQEQPQLRDLFWKMREHYVADLKPDLYIFLDVEPSVGLLRARGRGGALTHFDERALSFHTKVREGFLEFARLVDGIVVDAGQPMDAVKNQVLELC